MTSNQADRARLFRSLHAPTRPLVLPNVWDVATARLAEESGAPSVATTSAGVAWSLGAPDGGQLGRDRSVEHLTRIVAAVGVPVTADIEAGYASRAEGVAETVTQVLAAGAVGVNLEDAERPTREQCERITAARRAADAFGVPLFVNARIDTYLLQAGDPATRLRATLDRAAAYLSAGADGIFVPGVTEPRTVGALAAGVEAPLNIMVGPGAPTTAELAALGVARVSLGSAIAQAAYGLFRSVAREVLATGTWSAALIDAVDYVELNELLAAPPGQPVRSSAELS